MEKDFRSRVADNIAGLDDKPLKKPKIEGVAIANNGLAEKISGLDAVDVSVLPSKKQLKRLKKHKLPIRWMYPCVPC